MELLLTVGGIVLLFTILNACAASADNKSVQDGSGELFPSNEDDSWSLGGNSAWADSDDSIGSFTSYYPHSDDLIINPANGNLMVGGIGGIDTSGNAYGIDSSHDYSTSCFDDSFSSSFNSCASSELGGGGFSDW